MMARQRTDLLDPDEIKSNLKTRRIGRKILVYESTSSTNDVAAEYARNKQNDGLVVFAEEQIAGRGRAASQWLSGRADSILCSIVLIEHMLNAELLSLTCAVAVAEAIDGQGGRQAKIKWPNDIMLNGKKVAGILLESKSISECGKTIPALRPIGIPSTTLRTGLPTVSNKGKVPSPRRKSKIYVVGIGINCHQKKESFTDELQRIATSIDAESHSVSDRVLLAKRLLSSVDYWLEVAGKNSRDVIERWRSLSIQLGHRVTLVFNGINFSGHCIGIDPEKGLILQLDTGGVRMFNAAHSAIAR
jgi:BirA family biotin operon repressor/biotin-[acetyl-CoA-carboxylase] ligase